MGANLALNMERNGFPGPDKRARRRLRRCRLRPSRKSRDRNDGGNGKRERKRSFHRVTPFFH